MARKRVKDTGSWDRAQELLEKDDDKFVEELRRITDADELGNFAIRWFGDTRPQARRLMLVYLSRPLNAFRHEALIKRLFKIAEASKDDELMAHFLVALDRSVRRQRKLRSSWRQVTCQSQAQAQQLMQQWEEEGATSTNVWSGRTWGVVGRQQWHVSGRFETEALEVPPNTAMMRPYYEDARHGPYVITEHEREALEECRLFTVRTRNYLRRRAWRYFRLIGKTSPEKYVTAISLALKLYRNEDVGDGLALLDNWGLIHALFHHSPVLKSTPSAWRIEEDRALSEMQPAPYFEDLWKADAKAILNLILEGNCRPVRQWAIFMLKRDHSGILDALPLEEVFRLLTSGAMELIELAAELLRSATNLDSLGIERWLELLESEDPDLLNVICPLMQEKLQPTQIPLEKLVDLAKRRSLPVARLGFAWVSCQRPETEADALLIMTLIEADAEPLRGEIVQWVRAVLRRSPWFQPEWVLELIDSRHPEVRMEGWQWLLEGPRLRDNFEIWQKLFESPYDDVRLLLVAELEDRVARGDDSWIDRDALNEDLLRFLWASVLLNVHRGGRIKPLALEQISRRLQRKPEEAEQLLPLLRVALRSIRGPEWRAALTRIVQLMEHRPQLRETVTQTFPELELVPPVNC